MTAAHSPAPHRGVRLLVISGIVGLVSCFVATPASAGPGLPDQRFYAVHAPAFSVAPAVGGSIGETVVLWGNGAATATVDLPEPTVRLVFSARARLCEGPPRLDVRIDGVSVLGRAIAGSGRYAVAGRWGAGRHTVKFLLSNDRRSATCDRNLEISRVGWWGRYGMSDYAPPVGVSQGLDLGAVTFSPGSSGVSTGNGVMLWSTGSFAGTLDSQVAASLAVRMSGSDCQGKARFSLRVDGMLLASDVEVPEALGDGTSYYWVHGEWDNQLHTVELTYLNDLRTARCDRNLHVFEVSFYGRV